VRDFNVENTLQDSIGQCSTDDVIVVHAGTVKTGTTIIQKSLHHHREEFLSIGLRYPHITPPDVELPRYNNANFLYDQFLSSISKERLFEGGGICLISEETLFSDVDKLEFFDELPAQKHILIYIRRPAELLTSWAAEMAKPYNAFIGRFASGSGPLDIAADMDSVLHKYKAAIDGFLNFLAVHPIWKLIVQPYEPQRFQCSSILADLVSAIGLNATTIADQDWFAHPGRANPSWSRKVCDISSAIWHHLGCPTDPDIYNEKLVNRVAARCVSGDSRPVIETMTDAWILQATDQFAYFEAGVLALSRRREQLFANRLPKIFGVARRHYEPIDRDEVRHLTDLALVNPSET